MDLFYNFVNFLRNENGPILKINFYNFAGMAPRHGWAPMGPRDGCALGRDGPPAWMGPGHGWSLMGPQEGWAQRGLRIDWPWAGIGPGYVWAPISPRDGWVLGRDGPPAWMGPN